MAKYIDYKKQELELLQRTENYAKHVRDIYRNAFTDIIDLVKGTELEKGKPFSFSTYGYSEEVTPILRKMYSKVYQEIRSGVEREWLNSNDHNDELVKAVFGEEAIKTGHFAKYFARNMEAMDAFFTRKTADGGMNLSQKVWNYTGQYREELENALDLAIGEGTPANRVAAQVKGYLEDPDRFYRRFAYKVGEDEDGNPVYGRKWKRRIWDEIAQSYKWIDADPKHYHPGRGVYRSSARNAQRLARTEINMAYRAADHERWNQLDFVVGIEVKLSNNHNCKGVPKGTFVDICDDLKGQYPKEFKFVGWHPQCRCYAVPVLAPQENVEDILAKMIDGEEDVPVAAPNRVNKLPDNFQEWKDANEDRIAKAKARGTLPYFIRDNEDLIWKKKLTPKEIGQARHDGRTKIEIFEIKKKWNDRRATYQYGNNVMRIMGGISDVDTAALEAAIKSGDQTKILAESRKLKKIGKQIYAMDLLDDPMAVAKKFSMADAQAVNDAVNKTFGRWRWEDTRDSLEFLRGKLQFEIDFVTQRKKYSTWEVAKDAYQKRLDLVNYKLDKLDLTDSLSDVLDFATNKTKSKIVKKLLDEWEDLSAKNAPIKDLKDIADKLQKKYDAYKILHPKNNIVDDVNDFLKTPSAKTCQVTATDFQVSGDGVKVSANGYEALSDYHRAIGTEINARGRYVRTSNSFKLNGQLDDVGGNGVNATVGNNFKFGTDMYGQTMTNQDVLDIKAFDQLIAKRTAPFDVDIVRMVDSDGLAAQFGLPTKMIGKDMETALNGIIGKTVSAHRFLSFSTDISKNVFTRRNVMWHSKLKKGTHCYFADNGRESEVVCGRGMKLKITKFTWDKTRDTFEVWIDLSE